MSAGGSGTPLVSVCVPTFNDARFLRESLASIVRQSYERMEILVSDDASTDDTAAVVAEFDDPRIVYHRNERNLGQFENINAVVRRARGDFVAIYHSDDVYEPTIVEEEAAFLLGHPDAGAVFALDRWIDGTGRVFGQTRLPHGLAQPAHLVLDDVLEVLLERKNCLLRAPTFMARADVLAEVGRFEPVAFDIAGDLDYYLRVLERYPVGIIDKPLMRYRQDPTQVSSRYNHLRTVEEHFFPIMDRYVERMARRNGHAAALVEYEFHRWDDRTTRAVNHVVLGEAAAARALLAQTIPWGTLRRCRRRKVRVLLLHALLACGLAVRAEAPLARLLARTEYGTWGRP